MEDRLVIAAHRRHVATHPLFPAISGGLLFVVYLVVALFVLRPDVVWSPDEGAKLLQLKNLQFEAGHLRLDIEYPGRELDPNLAFALAGSSNDLLSVQDHALYFRRIPLFTLAVLPLYTWLGVPGLYVLPALGGALTCTLAFLMVEPCR